MSKTSANALDAKRIDAIAQSFASTCSGLTSSLDDLKTAKEATELAGNAANGTRETIMQRIAELSDAGQWTMPEIKAATVLAAKKINSLETAKAIATFIGECKRAAHPDVRDCVPMLLDIRNTAWDAETEQLKLDRASPSPLRHAFKRQYHAFIAAMAAVEDGRSIGTAADLVAYATERNPDLDAAKVFKRLEKIRQDLAEFHTDFPHEDIGFCVDTLADITQAQLSAARDTKLRGEPVVEEKAVVVVVKKPATVVAKKVVTAPVVAPVVAVKAPMVSADEILDQLLADNLTLVAA